MPIEAVTMDMHRHRLIRRVVVVRGRLRFLIEVQPRFDYGRAEHEVDMHPHGVVFRSPDLTMALEGVIAHTVGSHRRLGRCDGGVRATFELAAGESQSFMLDRVLFIAPTYPRWLSTLEAIGGELVSDSLVYRYNVDASPDGLRGDEGTFSMCSFWYAEALITSWRSPTAA
jgi:GH15 family glucan-1,4-alpha-glucosidase